MLARAYSRLEIKAVDEDKRIIEGIATTPVTDRMGDVVVSEGATFELPIPLLWQHDPHSPIGAVTSAKVTPKGIRIVAEIAKSTEPGTLKDRLDEAWQSMKLGLVKGLSIGFKSLEKEPLEDKDSDSFWGNWKFTKWLWLELSAVTIAANADASITAIKAADMKQLTALGRKPLPVVRLISPRDRGSPSNDRPQEGNEMKTIAEQIKALEDMRAKKQAAMEDTMQKAIEEGRSTDKEEQEKFDGLEREVEAIDADLKRYRALESIMATKAKPVDTRNTTDASHSRGTDPVTIRQASAPPGIRLARVVRCLGLAQGVRLDAARLADQLYKDDPSIAAVLRATVAAGTTVAGNWAEGLVGSETSVFADFVEFLRPRTILGRFGNNGIPSLRSVPFRTALVGQTGGGSGYWVGEGKAKPLTSFDFSRTTLEPLKVANIAVVTEELLRDSSPSVEPIIRDSLVAALAERLDLDFINPDKAAVAGVSPAGILNGISPIASTGNDADAIREDIRLVMAAFIANNNPPTTGVWVMSATNALGLSLLMNPLGQTEFPGITLNGGVFAGLPVITSEYITPNTSGDFVALINAGDIYIADEGGFQVDLSREASLEMSDAPAHTSDTPTPAQLVSMFQTNSVAFRGERTISWKRRRNEGVQWLNGVHWGAPVS